MLYNIIRISILTKLFFNLPKHIFSLNVVKIHLLVPTMEFVALSMNESKIAAIKILRIIRKYYLFYQSTVAFHWPQVELVSCPHS